MMNCLKTYYEKIGSDYAVSAGKYHNGYSGEETVFCDVLDLNTCEEVESIEIDFLDMFSAFCDMCRKYNV